MAHGYKGKIVCTQCGAPAIARQLCRPHYNAARRKGELDEHKSPALTDLFMAKVEKTDSCWIWMGGLNDYGYGIFSNGHIRTRAHRMSYEMHVGPIPDGLILLHSCDTPACVNPAHLKPGTRGDNNLDCTIKGRRPAGEKHWNARLTSEQIAEIKASTETSTAIAKRMGVSQPTISRIKTGARRKDG